MFPFLRAQRRLYLLYHTFHEKERGIFRKSTFLQNFTKYMAAASQKASNRSWEKRKKAALEAAFFLEQKRRKT